MPDVPNLKKQFSVTIGELILNVKNPKNNIKKSCFLIFCLL